MQDEIIEDFPGGPVVKNLPANAEDSSSVPGLGRSQVLRNNWICAPQLLSLCSKAHKQQLLSLQSRAHALQQEKPPQREAHTQQLERALTKQWRPSAATNK